MNVEDSLILMSDEIFRSRSGIALPVPQLQMALRSLEDFMDLSLDVPPTYAVALSDLNTAYAHQKTPSMREVDAVFIGGQYTLVRPIC